MQTNLMSELQTYSASESTADLAISKIAKNFDYSESAFLLIFASPRYSAEALEEAFGKYWDGLPVYGCSTAGEIDSDGYAKDTIVAINFPKSHFDAHEILYDFDHEKTLVEISEKTRRSEKDIPKPKFQNQFGLLLVDGTSKLEDIVVAAVDVGLSTRMPVFGGSAGDGMQFDETFIFNHRRCHRNAALLILVATDFEVRGIGFDHFEPTDERMVVTGAIPDQRILTELNGAPAAKEYARLIGKPLDDVTPTDFAENPLLVRSGEKYHVRSIKEVTPDGQIEMLAAIDYGLIFYLGRGKELLHTLVSELGSVTVRNKKPNLILGFDCVLRKLEIEQNNLSDEVSEILRQYKVVGFNTYGEQYVGVHVNQTFVGVAFFAPT